MPLHVRWFPLVLGIALTTATTPARASGGDTTAAGSWEMVIASAKRPWVFLVRLRAADAGWTGDMSVEGLAEFPLHDVRAGSGRVHFRLPPQLDSIVFDGAFDRDRIVGVVTGTGDTTAARLTRVAHLPAPANRLEAWRQDLDDAVFRLGAYDRSFTPRARARLKQSLTEMQLALPHRSDAEILVALSRAVALAGNAHTWLRLDPTRQGAFSTGFPIRIWWFSDGPFVLKAASQYARALRCRLVAIDGHDVSKVSAEVRSLFAGNVSWGDYLSPIYLTSPDILLGLGLIRDRQQASFTFRDARGNRFTLPIRAETLDPSAMPAESWQDLSPLVATGRPPWASALAVNAGRLPLWLEHAQQPYWFEFRPRTGMLYFQFNRSTDADAGPSFREFGDSLLAFAEQHPVRSVVVDLRLNSGGNLDVAQAFMQRLGANGTINRRGRLFVIVGHCTFSAGLYHAAQLKQFTHARFVGESVGDRLDYWAEGGEIVLPNSHAVIQYANGFHRYSSVDYPQNRPYYAELRIPSLTPDVVAQLSSMDYFAGRDPALSAIEARPDR